MVLAAAASRGIEGSYALSPMQLGMLFHHLQAQQPGVDVEQIVAGLHEAVDAPALARAWQRVVARHDILRTGFRWQGRDEPEQVVHLELEVPFAEEDWRGFPAAEHRRRLDEFLRADRGRGFDLARPPLLRLALFRLADEAYTLVWTVHHVLLDGRAFPLVLREVFALYEGATAGADLALPPPRPFRDHIAWLAGREFAGAESFWRESLRGFTTPTPLVVERRRGAGEATGTGHRAKALRLTEPTTARLRAFAERHEVTLNTLIQGAWSILLSRYSGEEQIVFGATRACRHSSVAGAETMVGIFINTLPVRARVTPERPLIAWLQELRASQIAVRPYEHTPLTKVQEWSDVPPGTPLFESLLMFDNSSLDATLRAAGGAWQRRDFRLLEETNFPMTLRAYGEPALLLDLEYAPERFDADVVERMLGHLRTLLEGMLDHAAGVVGDLPTLTADERRQVLVERNAAPATFPVRETLAELFAAQAARTPGAVAVTCDGASLTYEELNRRAERLARRLRAVGVGPEILVGLCAGRSLDLVVGIVGILKAGGAYLPLDPDYPAERLAFMLEDSRAPVLVAQAHLAGKLATSGARIVTFDGLGAPDEAGADAAPPPSSAGPDNLAYVIYTSGSTGRPKGVMVSQANVVRLFRATEGWFGFGAGDVWTLFHSAAFDFSVWELWGALLYGGRLVVVPHAVSRDPASFRALLARERVTVLNQTPSAFRQLIAADATAANDLALRLVIFGGEALELQALRPWFARHGDRAPQLVNMYGITETTVHVTYRPLTARDPDEAPGSVIGRAIPDLCLYILDGRCEPVPIGVPGELYVGGAGVARGYLNRPELTAERFIPDPFAAVPGARLYKTGDLARRLPDGDIEYLGRLDHQVKIRGFRIELGEIEAALARHPGVREAVVLAREDAPGDRRLVAYLVPEAGGKVAVAALRDAIRARLPEHMIPASFVLLAALPLTDNGKIDRKALPAPATERGAATFSAPRTALERDIAHIWAELLRVEQVGLGDNFFELGGHSLLIVRLQGRLRERLGREVAVTDLFRHSTVGALAAFLDRATPARPSFTEAQSRAASQRQALARQRQVVRGGRHA
jgi:amino acid adenylation domain-containing protein